VRTLTFDRPNLLSKLHDELLAAVPAVRPVTGPDGTLVAVMRVEGDGNLIRLTVPDAADETAITAVVAAHDPTPDPVPDFGNDATTRDQLVSGVTQLRAYLALSNPTAAQSAAALKLVIRGFLFLLKEQYG
jgi:hypothetical protein